MKPKIWYLWTIWNVKMMAFFPGENSFMSSTLVVSGPIKWRNFPQFFIQRIFHPYRRSPGKNNIKVNFSFLPILFSNNMVQILALLKDYVFRMTWSMKYRMWQGYNYGSVVLRNHSDSAVPQNRVSLEAARQLSPGREQAA